MKAFRAPENSIGSLDAATAATLVATATDLALVLDHAGIIEDMAFQQSDLSLELEGYGRWLGRPWSETVSPESQPKVETLLREAATHTASGWRQLTHQTIQGREVPILYSAVRLNGGSRVLALGRDLRAVAALQQRLVDAQMSMERDYAKLRFAETRYRLLFQNTTEPVLILDGHTGKIVEANPAAETLMRGASRTLIGRSFTDLFDPAGRARVQTFLADVRGGSQLDDLDATLAQGAPTSVAATVFRQEGSTLLLVRVAPRRPTPAIAARPDEARITAFVEASPDGFVLADVNGHVLTANSTFAEMVQTAENGNIGDMALDQILGRSGVDFDVLMANLRQHGTIRLFATALRGVQGATRDVEVSAVALGSGKSATFGFIVRDVSRRLAAPRTAQDLPHSAEQLTELIGRVPLKDLVRETTDVIEKLCIEAALELTNDNRASAAEVLGLSRQSLYVKLRRFGLAEAGADDELR